MGLEIEGVVGSGLTVEESLQKLLRFEFPQFLRAAANHQALILAQNSRAFRLGDVGQITRTPGTPRHEKPACL